MTQPIDPTQSVRPERRAKERRAKERRDKERRQGDKRRADSAANLPVPVTTARDGPKSEPKPDASTVFTAQLLGQPGQKRGLKGGPVVLDAARSAYLGAEWSGPADRRHRAGKITKTEL